MQGVISVPTLKVLRLLRSDDIREIEKNIKEAIDLYLEDDLNPCELLKKGEFTLKFKLDAAISVSSSMLAD